MPRGLLNCSIEGRNFFRYVVSYNGEQAFNVGLHDIFVSLVHALDSSAAQAVGIVRRASNYGLTGAGSSNVSRFTQGNVLTNPGTGLTRWERANPPGQNAWVLYEFSSATVPFWVLIQFSKESIDFNYNRFGESPGNPSSTQHFHSDNAFGPGTSFPTQLSRQNGINIAVGLMANGSSPWNGTINNNGADTKGSRVWKLDAAKFPRANDHGGWAFVDMARMIPLIHEISAIYNPGYGGLNPRHPTGAIPLDAFNFLYHIIFDQNNLLIFMDSNGIGSAGSIFYFGKYQPFDSRNTVPYVCLFRNSCLDVSFDAIATADTHATTNVPYGCINSNGTNDHNGLIGYMQPYLGESQLINGGVYNPAIGHTTGCIVVMPPHMNSDMRQIPNSQMRVDNSDRIKHIASYADIYSFEYSNKHGFLGRSSFFKVARNVRTGHFFSDNELIIGNPGMGSKKMIVPWDPNTPYGVFGNRYGTLATW